MRREGFEMGVSRPQVIMKEVDGETQEPYENVTFDVEEQHQGSVMEQMGNRKGELTNMEVDGKGRIRIEATVPSRASRITVQLNKVQLRNVKTTVVVYLLNHS
ncbi:unnamed protein product [Oppiella nova]|uniref:Elongation factor EFG domain-containing protein n=1 Tax=Oppiella nova TaxID=334625 RepID=A0A7R9L932_9ACAR|nr:unnamed protein product [Oppiella nova]CAG2155864.1 unnamed protein product [Oppiella nova]